VVGFRAVGEGSTALRALLAAVCVVVFTALQLPAASGAGSPSKLREHAQALRAQNGSLNTQERAAWLSTLSLRTRLEHTQAALAQLRARTRAIVRRRSDTEAQLTMARQSLAVSQRHLANRLRTLYEQGDTDPMAVLLGAKSVDDAITGLESVHRIAGQDRLFIKDTEAARHRLIGLTRSLAVREAQAREAEEATAASIVALASAKRERASMLISLNARRTSNSATISALEAQAPHALAAAQPRPAATPLPAPAGNGRVLTVTATGYSLTGRTATGVAVGYGVVAVDPNVIPLGTRMTIPGYGEGVAADTGGAVSGSRIDLWFPTRAEALAWGARTVTIRLH
jgi:3D (Asp-Asp-Asp) domain-containing protein/peptidoglycan hydrolase CwlO-like protein